MRCLTMIYMDVKIQRTQCRTPVDCDLLLRGQAGLKELQEDPLRPAHIVLVGGGQLAGPRVQVNDEY